MLSTNATEEVVVNPEDEIKNFKQTEYMSGIRNSEVLWKKALRNGGANSEVRLKEVIIEGLRESVRFSMRAYLRTRRVTTT